LAPLDHEQAAIGVEGDSADRDDRHWGTWRHAEIVARGDQPRDHPLLLDNLIPLCRYAKILM
jgi:hypothetical protein